MANKFLTIDMITNEAVMEFGKHLVVAAKVNRTYSKMFGKEGAKIGDSLRVRKQSILTVADGASLQTQDIIERSVTVEFNKRKHIGVKYNSQDRVLNMSSFNERVVKPAVCALAHEIEADIISLFPTLDKGLVWDSANTAVKPFSVFAKAKAMLENSYIPNGDLYAVIGPFSNAILSESLTQLAFNNDKSAKALDKNKVGHLAGIDIYTSPLLQNAVFGSGVAETAIQVNGASQVGLEDGVLVIKGLVGTLKRGDTFTIAGVYEYNSIAGTARSNLKQFTVLEDVAAGGTSVKFSSPMIGTGPYKNVSELPANNAVVSFVGTASGAYELGAIFTKDAFALVSADLPLQADSNKTSRAVDEDVNVSIRVVDTYDNIEDETILRFDVLYGVNTLDANQGVKIMTKF